MYFKNGIVKSFQLRKLSINFAFGEPPDSILSPSAN
jgi:hypothetical protein